MIGNIIKTKREQMNLTQEQLASKLYVERTTISKWEKDKNIPRPDTLKDIAKLLDIDINLLMNNIDTDRMANANMSNLNKKFINLQTNKDVGVFIEEIIKDFKFDKYNEETLKSWIINYLYATILSELDYRDNIMSDNDEFDIYNLVVDLEDDALNGLFRDNFKRAYDKTAHMEGDERIVGIARVYEIYNWLEKPDNLITTMLNLSLHINKLANQQQSSIAGYLFL